MSSCLISHQSHEVGIKPILPKQLRLSLNFSIYSSYIYFVYTISSTNGDADILVIKDRRADEIQFSLPKEDPLIL